MKRILDILLALLALLMFWPILLTIFILVRLNSRGPSIHWSKRIGQHNRLFMMPKFRTMQTETPQVATHLLVDSSAYVTSVGRVLRKLSLDELPQLYSVLKGDMSLVGPRPALFNQYDLRDLRTEVGVDQLKPGVTGWAQINGRDEISIEAKVKLDEYYLNNQSISFDLFIIFLTAWRVIKKQDISH